MAKNYEYHLLLGGNLKETLQSFKEAIKLLNLTGTVIKTSKIYESEPWGYESEHRYKNQAIIFQTEILPFDLLKRTQEIEKKIGRKKTKKTGYEDRIIDIDILFAGNSLINAESLKIPHPMLHLRMFTLNPLLDISPRFIHPIFQKSIRELRDELIQSDQSTIN